MTILTVERHGPVAVLTLDRPDSMNALGSAGDGDAVAEACTALNADQGVRAAVLTGRGKAFSAGGNIKAMADPQGPFSGDGAKLRDHYRHNIHRVAKALFGLDMPLIAAVNGPAIGLGCDIACMADVRIASDKAAFGVTFLKLGLVPGDGGAWLLPRVIGMSRASELFFTGDVIGADTAADWGLVSRVVPHDRLMEEAMRLAERMAAMPGHALRFTKTLLRQGQTTGYDAALETAAITQVVSHAMPDHQEGVAAMIEKRPPLFNRE